MINLLPSHQNPIENEEFLVEQSSMDYIHIPVEWDNPKETDFDSFVVAMKKSQGKKIVPAVIIIVDPPRLPK